MRTESDRLRLNRLISASDFIKLQFGPNNKCRTVYCQIINTLSLFLLHIILLSLNIWYAKVLDNDPMIHICGVSMCVTTSTIYSCKATAAFSTAFSSRWHDSDSLHSSFTDREEGLIGGNKGARMNFGFEKTPMCQ